MAFGGVQVNTPAGIYAGQGGYNILDVTGLTLAATVAFPPVRANADTGVLSTNNGAIDAVPANTSSVPAAFGPGQDNWTADDVESLTVLVDQAGATAAVCGSSKARVANVNPAPAGSNIANANAEVTIHNKSAVVATLAIRLIYEHSIIR